MKMDKMKFSRMMKWAQALLFFAVLLVAGSVMAQAAPEAAAAAETAVAETDGIAASAKYIAVGLTMFGGSLAAGLAVGKVGSAAMGAAAEKPEVLSKAIIYVGLGEGIALFGFLIALFMLI